MAPQQDLYLVGLGIDFRKHVTVEAAAVLKRSRIILHIDENPRWLRRFNPNIESLKRLYYTGEERRVVYDRLIRRTLDEIDRGPGVSLVTYGHPYLFDHISRDLREHCRRTGRSVHVVPGISSLDTLAVDLGIEYSTGLQIYECTALVRERQLLNNRAHTLLFQVGEYGFVRTSDDIDPARPRYGSLIRYLRRFYPASHPVTVSYSDDGLGRMLHRMSLDKLDRNRRKIFPGTTLYVPPVKTIVKPTIKPRAS